MSSIKRFTFILATLLLFSGAGLVSSVSAHDGEGSSSSGSSSSQSENEMEAENEAHDLAEQFKAHARDKVSQLRNDGKEHRRDMRKKSCEARKQSITKKMNNAVLHAQKHKEVFDKIYTRVKAFHDKKQLNVSNYDSLTATVDAAQTNAQASIDALKALDININCTSDTLAENISAFREAVKSSRDSLKDYRKSLVELIKALKGASTGATQSTNGSDE